MPSPIPTFDLPNNFHYDHLTDGAALVQALHPWLIVDQVPFALVCGVAAKTDPGHWCGVLSHNGQPIIAWAQTPPWPVIVATPVALNEDVLHVVVSIFKKITPTIQSVNGPAVWVEAIAAQMGTKVVGRQGVRLHQLRGTPRLPHAPLGRARVLRENEMELLQSWLYEFSVEATPEDPQPRLSFDKIKLMLPECWAWTIDDKPVSLARTQRPFYGGWTIGPVYTPLAHRCHGYAGAVVHAQCQRLLHEGTSYIALYTDLANPTSNKLYAAIGFEPKLDQLRVTWS